MAIIRKKLDTILGAFSKIAADLDSFIGQARKDIDVIAGEQVRLSADRAVLDHDIARAERTKAKIAELVA